MEQEAKRVHGTCPRSWRLRFQRAQKKTVCTKLSFYFLFTITVGKGGETGICIAWNVTSRWSVYFWCKLFQTFKLVSIFISRTHISLLKLGHAVHAALSTSSGCTPTWLSFMSVNMHVQLLLHLCQRSVIPCEYISWFFILSCWSSCLSLHPYHTVLFTVAR